MRAGLAGLTPFYRGAVSARNVAYDLGWKTIERAGAPVASVGNLTTGGTGKTPMVDWIVQTFRSLGARPGIVSRGYRSLDGQENDEKRMLDALCPGVPHVQNPNRAAAAREAVQTHGCNVLVLDDGFQHRRLARDLDIVLVDALNPWGYDWLLPRGLLREPLSSLRRADVVCVTRTDQIPDPQRRRIHDTIRRHSAAPITEVSFRPTRLVTATGATAPLEELAGKAVGGCCGVGNPSSFFRTLANMGVPLNEDARRVFPDHHHYSAADIESLKGWLAAKRIEILVVTRKDLVKLPFDTIGPTRLVAIDIGVRWESGRDTFEQRLKALCGGDRL